MEISVYGAAGCPRMAMVTEFISAGGAQVRQRDIESEPLSQDLLERLIAFEQDLEFSSDSDNPAALPVSGQDASPDTEIARLRQLLRDRPSTLSIPLAVRGSRVVLASSTDRIQSLMY